MRTLLAGLVLLAAVLAGGCSRLLFFPQQKLVRTPADLGLAFRDVTFAAADGTVLHGWWLDAAAPVQGTVYFLHGNAENISTHIGSVYWLPAAGYQVFLLDYRGYGRSGGKAHFPEVLTDIEAGFRWLGAQAEVRDAPLFLLGQSLGASLGGYVVGTHPEIRAQLSGVILDSGFARYRWIAQDVAAQSWLTWPLQWPISWTMPRGYDLVDAVTTISPVPVLVMHGREDTIVPYRHAEAVYAAAKDPKSFIAYDGGHIAGFNAERIRQRVLEFLGYSVRLRP